jgi:oligopeptide transport system substrate-binding protein
MPLLRRTSAVIAALWIIASFCRCSPAAGSAKTPGPKKAQRIRAVIFPQPKSLIPHEGDYYVDGQITDMIFNNLVQANYLGSLAPELAESWEISPNHREYTFHLRKNVRFHDGRPFTAADVLFTLEKLIEKSQGKYVETNYIDGCADFLSKRTPHVRGLQKNGDYTLTIRLNENFKFFLQFLAAEYTAIMPENYAGMSEALFRKQPVGTGPFRLIRSETTIVGTKPFLVFRLEKNKGYFAATGNLDAIDFYSANTSITDAEMDYFDLLYISTNEIPELARKPDYRIINSSYDIINFLVLNPNENSQMRERKIRQLVNYAINREDLARKVFHRKVLPAHSMMPYGLLGYNPYYRLDYSRAEKIRAELPPGKIQFTIMTVAKDERQRVAEFVRQELSRFNVEVTVITITDQYDYFNRQIYNTNTSVVMGGIPDYPSAYHFLTHLVEPNGYFNVFKFTLPALQAKIKTLPSLDTVNETRTLSEISAAFEDDALYIPLYHYANFIAIRERIKTIGFKYGEITDFAGLEVEE